MNSRGASTWRKHTPDIALGSDRKDTHTLPYMGTRPPAGIGSLRDCGTVHQGGNNASKTKPGASIPIDPTPKQEGTVQKQLGTAPWEHRAAMHYQTAALQSLADMPRTCDKDALLIYAEKQAAQMKCKQSHIHPRNPCFSILRHAFIHAVGGLANFFRIGVRESGYVSCMATTSEIHAQGTALQHQSAAPRAQAPRCKNRTRLKGRAACE